ncbi:MAG: DUF4112 domain-containing protein [Longimicrobiales bacterium]
MNRPPDLERLRVLARVMDDAVRVPGTNVRLGLDALIGLIPGLGDVAGGLTNSYIILGAQKLGAPTSVLLRMVWNVLVDTLFGSIPFLGDLFDIGYRANRRNVQLLEKFAANPRGTKRASRAVVALLLVLVALIAIGGAILAWLMVRAIWRGLRA